MEQDDQEGKSRRGPISQLGGRNVLFQSDSESECHQWSNIWRQKLKNQFRPCLRVEYVSYENESQSTSFG